MYKSTVGSGKIEKVGNWGNFARVHVCVFAPSRKILFDGFKNHGSFPLQRMCKLRGRKAKAQQTSQLHPGQLFFPRKKEELPCSSGCGTLILMYLRSIKCFWKFSYGN